MGDGTGTLSIDTSSSDAGNSQGAGILASDGSRLTINGNLQIKTYGGSCFADGIYMMRAGTGTGAGVPITPPTVINKVLPVYPPSAKMKKTTGITYVTILVNASGTVDSAYVAQGSGSSVLDAAAIDAAYQWTFSPALDKYGVPVPCRITFPVEFRLN